MKLISVCLILISADNSSPMTPPLVGSFSPNNNMCDQNQVTSTLDGLSQDLQNPMSPMQPAQHVQPSQSASQQQPSSQNQLNDMPNMVETLGVPLQQNIIDPYRRPQGNYHICHIEHTIPAQCFDKRISLIGSVLFQSLKMQKCIATTCRTVRMECNHMQAIL